MQPYRFGAEGVREGAGVAGRVEDAHVVERLPGRLSALTSLLLLVSSCRCCCISGCVEVSNRRGKERRWADGWSTGTTRKPRVTLCLEVVGGWIVYKCQLSTVNGEENTGKKRTSRSKRRKEEMHASSKGKERHRTGAAAYASDLQTSTYTDDHDRCCLAVLS